MEHRWGILKAITVVPLSWPSRKLKVKIFPVPMECWIYVHPWKLTWNPKMEIWKMIFLFKQVIFRFHVHFPGCICWSRNRPSQMGKQAEANLHRRQPHHQAVRVHGLEKPCRANKNTGNPASQIWISETCLSGWLKKTYRNNEMFWSGRLWFRLFRINRTLHRTCESSRFFVHCEASGL